MPTARARARRPPAGRTDRRQFLAGIAAGGAMRSGAFARAAPPTAREACMPEPHVLLPGLADKPWNESVVAGRGNAYVGNIGVGFPAGEFAPGIVALVAPDGAARQVADGLAFANGLVVTPANATLVVAASCGNRLTAFDSAPDGALRNRRVWAELGGGVPDGICPDAEGAVWSGDVPNRRCARVRAGGGVRPTFDLDRGRFACMLGGADRQTPVPVANELPDLGNAAGDAARTGQVLAVVAPAPGAGRP